MNLFDKPWHLLTKEEKKEYARIMVAEDEAQIAEEANEPDIPQEQADDLFERMNA